MIYLPIFVKVSSLALGHSYDCPSAKEATLKDMGTIEWHSKQQMAWFCYFKYLSSNFIAIKPVI